MIQSHQDFCRPPMRLTLASTRTRAIHARADSIRPESDGRQNLCIVLDKVLPLRRQMDSALAAQCSGKIFRQAPARFSARAVFPNCNVITQDW